MNIGSITVGLEKTVRGKSCNTGVSVANLLWVVLFFDVIFKFAQLFE